MIIEDIGLMVASGNSDLPKSGMPVVGAPSFDFSTTSLFRVGWVFYFLFVTVALLYGYLIRQVPGLPSAFLMVYSMLFFVAAVFAIPTFLEGRNGTYHIDETGIRFSPVLGRAYLLAWSDVERVKWIAHGVVIAGNYRKLVLTFTLMPPGERVACKGAVMAWLSRYFDLPEKRKRRPATWREILKMWRQLLLYLLPALGLVAYAYAKGMSDPEHDKRWEFAMIAALALPLILWLPEARRNSRLPDNPHRWLSRKPGASSTK